MADKDLSLKVTLDGDGAGLSDAVKKANDEIKGLGGSTDKAKVSAEALEQAFRTVGVRPLKDVTAEVQRLQSALATIKAAGIVGPDQDAAIAAFQARIGELRRELGRVPPSANNAAQSIESVGRSAGETGSLVGSATKSLAGMAAALAGLGSVAEVAKGVVQTGAAFETLEARLNSLLGSADSAKEAMGQIKQLAITTPFEVSALADSFIKLTAFGLQPSMQQMRALSDTAATLGGGTETLAGVTTALGQAWAKGKLQGEEILQLAERGVPVWDVLAQATGKNTAELQKMSEAGTMGRETILKLIDALGQVNAGASEKLMATFSGAVSNAKDALAEFYDMVAKAGVLEFLTKQVQDLLAEFERMKASGELQQAANDIAKSFIAIGEGVRTAIEAINSLSTVIKLTVEVWVAWRVSAMTLIPALGGVSAAATTTAAATASAAAAATTATRSFTAMATAMRLVKGLTLVGLVEGAISLGMEFFRAKSEAEKLDKQVKKMLEPTPINGPAEGMKAVVTEAEAARFKLTEFQSGLMQLQEQGKSTGDALKDMVGKANVDSPKGITDLIKGLDSVKAGAMATGEQIQTALIDKLAKMTSKDLADFGMMAEMAFTRGDISAQALTNTLNASTDAALQKLGVSAEVSLGGLSRKFSEASSALDILTKDFDRVKESGVDAGGMLRKSFEKAISTAESQADLAALEQKIKDAGAAGRLAKQDVAAFLDTVKKKADDALPGVNSLAEAFRTLGMKTPDELKRTAAQAAEAFNTIKNSADYTAQGVNNTREAFKKYAEAAIAANGGVASEMVKAQAWVNGYTVEIDNAGKATLRLKGSADEAVGGIAVLSDQMEAGGAAAERAAAQYDRLANSMSKAAGGGGGGGGVQKGSDGILRNEAGQHVGPNGDVLKDRNGNPITNSTSLLDMGSSTYQFDLKDSLYAAGASIAETEVAAKYVGELFKRKMMAGAAGVRSSQDNNQLITRASKEAVDEALRLAKAEMAGAQVDIGPSVSEIERRNKALLANRDFGPASDIAFQALRNASESAGREALATPVNITIGGQTRSFNAASQTDAVQLVNILKQLETQSQRAS